MHQRIQTFKPRRGRYSTQQRQALERATHLLELGALPPLTQVFDHRPVILEIGFGMGDATIAQAIAHPETGILAIDVHTPGVGRLLAELETHHVHNVRVIEGDALQLLESLPDCALAGVRIFFPDPWPKARHHKRRIVTPTNLDLLATRIVPGGFLHFATDWQEYAIWTANALAEHSAFLMLTADEQPALANASTRPRTKFERRGIAAGRPITDLVARRIEMP